MEDSLFNLEGQRVLWKEQMEKQQIDNEEKEEKEEEKQKQKEDKKDRECRSHDASICFTDGQYLYIMSREQQNDKEGETTYRIMIDVYDSEQKWQNIRSFEVKNNNQTYSMDRSYFQNGDSYAICDGSLVVVYNLVLSKTNPVIDL